MNSASTHQLPLTTLDDDAWEDLLSFIEEHPLVKAGELASVKPSRIPRTCFMGFTRSYLSKITQ